MPKKRKHYDSLKDEVLNLISKKNSYLELYGQRETVDLLNNISANCFGTIQRIYNDSLILSITKLLDPIHTGGTDKKNKGSKNLVLELLINDVNDKSNQEILNNLLNDIRDLSQKYKQQRNKVLAHLDYRKGVKNKSLFLAIDEQELLEIIEKIISFMQLIEDIQGYSNCTYEIIYSPGLNCDYLIDKLKMIEKASK